MADPTDQQKQSDRTNRSPLFILVLAAVIGAGIWYWQTRTDPEDPSRQPVSTETTTGTAPAAGDSETAESGVAQTDDSGTVSSADTLPATGTGTTAATDSPQTIDSGATPREEERELADSGVVTGAEVPKPADADAGAAAAAEAPKLADAGVAAGTEVPKSADAGTAVAAEVPKSADAGTAVAAEVPKLADAGAVTRGKEPMSIDPGAAEASGDTQTAGTGASTPMVSIRTTDSSTTGTTPRIAAVEPGTSAAKEEITLASAPDDAIEQKRIDAPPDTDTTDTSDILAMVERTIERIEATVREQLIGEPETEPEGESEAEPETRLRVHVTYDDSQEEVAPAGGEPNQTARTAEPDATFAPSDRKVPDSGGTVPTDIAKTPEPDGAAPTDVSGPAASDSAEAEPDAALAPTDRKVPDSGGTVPTDIAKAPEPDGAAPTDVSGSTASASAEARKFVESLTDTAPQTIPVDKADHFVTQERVISLVPEDDIENVSVEGLANDETLSPDTPITVVREVEQIETAVPEQLIADSKGNLDEPLRVRVTYDDSQGEMVQSESPPKVAAQDTVEEMTVREALERIRTEPEKPLSVIRTVRYFEVMTLRELLDSAGDDDTFLNVVTRPYRIESATLADLLQREKAENPDSIFYLHTVEDTDDQGIWGIVHFGLIDNFARGMAIRRGEDVETYTVRIPRDADERLDDLSSSFLGLLIDGKTKDSFVYNYRENRMGRNPDRIYPGQEIVIIKFDPEELIAIYRHFAAS